MEPVEGDDGQAVGRGWFPPLRSETTPSPCSEVVRKVERSTASGGVLEEGGVVKITVRPEYVMTCPPRVIAWHVLVDGRSVSVWATKEEAELAAAQVDGGARNARPPRGETGRPGVPARG